MTIRDKSSGLDVLIVDTSDQLNQFADFLYRTRPFLNGHFGNGNLRRSSSAGRVWLRMIGQSKDEMIQKKVSEGWSYRDIQKVHRVGSRRIAAVDEISQAVEWTWESLEQRTIDGLVSDFKCPANLCSNARVECCHHTRPQQGTWIHNNFVLGDQ